MKPFKFAYTCAEVPRAGKGKWAYICTHSAIDHIFKGPGKVHPI